MSEPPAEYDRTWKEALQEYFNPFLGLCFSEIHGLIDWSKPTQSLDKEMEQIARGADSGTRFADKLFQVWLREGTEARVLIHVEVQSQEESNFAKRMYQYNYRAFDLYEQPAISLAVLGDDRASWRPSAYRYTLDGYRLTMEFPIVKLLDYETQWQSLEENSNPFAVMIMAHLKTKATTGKPQDREQWKWHLVRGLFERGYDRDEIQKLFRLVDWMMTLPEALQRSFEAKVTRYQEDRQMPLLSHMEIRAMEKGMQQGIEQGMQQGIEQGIEQGILQTLRENALEILQDRFGEVPPEVSEAINSMVDTSLLKRLHRQAIAIPSIEEFQQLLSPGETQS